ncbi:MAG TPA: YcxB family protein [Pyrinomonadaceae bacterium]|jgi:hypothetical protein
MEVTYKLNLDDVQAYQWHNIRTSATLRRNYRAAFVSFPLIILGVMILFVVTGLDILFAGFCFVVSTALWALVFPHTYRRNINRATVKLLGEGRNELLQHAHRMSLDETGLNVRSGIGESRLAWSAVERVEETETHIYIYIGALTAYVVPKWAFATRREAEDFFDAARSFQRRAEA